MGGMAKRNYELFVMFGLFVWKYVDIIRLKAPGNYSASFWSNKISVLLLERPKSPNSMMSGFLSPGEHLFMDFNIPKYYNKMRRIVDAFLQNIICYKCQTWENQTL